MAASASTPDLEERPTRLTGKKDGYSFEIWVKVDGEPAKVYGEAELDEGGSEAWIASEEGKVRVVCLRRAVTYTETNHLLSAIDHPQPYTIGVRMKNDNVSHSLDRVRTDLTSFPYNSSAGITRDITSRQNTQTSRRDSASTVLVSELCRSIRCTQEANRSTSSLVVQCPPEKSKNCSSQNLFVVCMRNF
jgi:hypothetical protein